MKRVLIALLFAIVSCQPVLAQYEVSLLTDAGTDILEARGGVRVTDNWTVGLSGTLYTESILGEDGSGDDWAVGLYAKMLVNPNMVIPVADWFPSLADLLGLPETVEGATYAIGKLEGVHAKIDEEEKFTGALSAGAGVNVGPLTLEYLYGLVEGGETDDPLIISGSQLNLGLTFAF